MKKIIANIIILMFVLSILPVAFAEERSSDTGVSAGANAEVKTSDGSTKETASQGATRESTKERNTKLREEAKIKLEARKQANADKLKALRAEQMTKIEALSAEKSDRISNLSSERLQKIADLDKAQMERLAALNVRNLDKITELKKERLERLAELSQEKLQKISDLDQTDIEKFSTLNRARLNQFANLDKEKLKAELKAIRIVKVKNAEDLDERKISEAKLSELRLNFDKAKERFDKAKGELDDTREKLKEAKAKDNKNETVRNAKDYLLKAADILIAHLEKIKARIQESKNINAEQEAKVVSVIDAKIAEINTIKTEVQAATAKEQIKEAAKKLRNLWTNLNHLVNLYSERVVSARVEGIINRGEVLEKKLDNVLEEAKVKGIQIDVSAEISQFSEKIALAKDKYAQAQAKLSAMLELKAGNATNDQVKAAADEAKSLLKESRDAIKQAHDILKEIVKKIREAYKEADLSKDVEVEVEHGEQGQVENQADVKNETDNEAIVST